MDRVENAATPFTAATVVVPDSVPPPGLLPMATVTLAVELVTVLPNASCTATCTAGLIAAPAVAFVNPAEVAVSVYPVPDRSMDRLENVATPELADTVVVPDSVPPPGLVPM